jgi:hypothetical protein
MLQRHAKAPSSKFKKARPWSNTQVNSSRRTFFDLIFPIRPSLGPSRSLISEFIFIRSRAARALVRTLALKFCIGFIRSRDRPAMSVSPELDHFFLVKRRAGERWPSAGRAGELIRAY